MTQREAEHAALESAAKLVKEYRTELKKWKGAAVILGAVAVMAWMTRR